MPSSFFYKPVTPSLRFTSLPNKKFPKKQPLLKNLLLTLKHSTGRNNQGIITVFRKGSGHKKRYRPISFSSSFFFSGIVESIEYDPYRTANIARVFSKSLQKHFYILAPQNLKVGHFVESQLNHNDLKFKLGNTFYLKDVHLGTFLHNVFFPGSKGAAARAAGSFVQLISKNQSFCRVKLNSGEYRLFDSLAQATIGIVSNSLHKRRILGKAGRSRWLNKRPTVRGAAMNPVDHPHGGRTSGGTPSYTPWGKLTLGKPTRKKLPNKYILYSRKK